MKMYALHRPRVNDNYEGQLIVNHFDPRPNCIFSVYIFSALFGIHVNRVITLPIVTLCGPSYSSILFC